MKSCRFRCWPRADLHSATALALSRAERSKEAPAVDDGAADDGARVWFETKRNENGRNEQLPRDVSNLFLVAALIIISVRLSLRFGRTLRAASRAAGSYECEFLLLKAGENILPAANSPACCCFPEQQQQQQQ